MQQGDKKNTIPEPGIASFSTYSGGHKESVLKVSSYYLLPGWSGLVCGLVCVCLQEPVKTSAVEEISVSQSELYCMTPS